MDNLDIRNELVDYLAKKGIDIYYDEYNDLVWKFKIHYTKFKVSMSYYGRQYNDDVITYYCSNYVRGIKRRRTGINKHNNHHRLKVYKNLLYIKSELESIAIAEKTATDIKKEYCIEIERHYKRKHKHVNVSSHKNRQGVSIRVTGYDKGYVNDTEYRIEYIDKKYLLLNKKENKKIDLNMEQL